MGVRGPLWPGWGAAVSLLAGGVGGLPAPSVWGAPLGSFGIMFGGWLSRRAGPGNWGGTDEGKDNFSGLHWPFISVAQDSGLWEIKVGAGSVSGEPSV